MKIRSLSLLAVLTTSTFFVAPVFAAPDSPSPRRYERRGPMGFGGGGRFRPGMGLDLTPAQEKKMTALMRSTFTQRRAVMENPNLSPKQKQIKWGALRTQFRSKMDAILTPAQRKKRNAMRQQREKMRQREMAEQEAA